MRKPVTIIAEAGVNHNGSLELAKKMAEVAKECGADIVKFQTAQLDALVSKYAGMAEYQKKNMGHTETQREMLSKLLLSYNEFTELATHCKKVGISFLSTPFDIESIHFLNDMQELWKIPSGEITNYPYLLEIAKTKKPVIMSTGMANMEEIRAAYEVLKSNGTSDITLLHCTTEYPAPIEEVNLKAMLTLKETFQCKVGYSDHTVGNEADIAAVALGAGVIEKHFTLDRSMSGPDHKASLEPEGLMSMVASIRSVELALGTGIKEPTESEIKNRDVARKSIVAKKAIKQGDIFSSDNLACKRPGNGVSPMRWNELIGKKAKKNYEVDEMIKL